MSFSRALQPVLSKIRGMIARGVISIVNDATKLQQVQADFMENQTSNDVERFQQYGFTSSPLPGASCLAVFLGGDRSHPIILAVDDPRHRVKNLQSGEVAIYTDEGDSIIIKRGGEVLIKASTKIRMETPLLEVTGEIVDNCDDGSPVNFKSFRQIYNTHTHNETQIVTNVPNQQVSL